MAAFISTQNVHYYIINSAVSALCLCAEGNQLPRMRSENTSILGGSETDEMAMEAQKGAAARACCDGRSVGGMSTHRWRPRQPSTDHMDPPKCQQRVQISSSSWFQREFIRSTVFFLIFFTFFSIIIATTDLCPSQWIFCFNTGVFVFNKNERIRFGFPIQDGQ